MSLTRVVAMKRGSVEIQDLYRQHILDMTYCKENNVADSSLFPKDSSLETIKVFGTLL